MKASDFDRVRALLDKRAAATRLRDRLASGEPVALAVGTGPGMSAIELSPGYQAELRRDFIAALEHEIRSHEDALRALGVEP